MQVVEYLRGTPLSTFESSYVNLPSNTRRRVASVVLQKMAPKHGFYADYHSGSILVKNRKIDIALLDFVQTKRFDAPIRLAFVSMVRAISQKDARDVEQAMCDLSRRNLLCAR